MIETKITRLLDAVGVAYRVLPHSEPVFTVEAAAAQRGVVAEEMVKSILLRESKGQRYVMACVPGPARLNPQVVRQVLPGKWKRMSFASREQIKAITGYTQGAVAPLCLPAEVPVLFDQALAKCRHLTISSGDPMAGLELQAADLIRLAKAILAPLSYNT